jgi:hypothetical protein
MSYFQWEPEDPLARAKGESTKANRALQDYADLGPGRSLALLAKGYAGEIELGEPGYDLFRPYRVQSGGEPGAKPPSKRLSTLEGWSSRYQWQARLAAYQDLENEKREAIREARREALEDLDWENGESLRQAVMQYVEELPKFLVERTQKVEQEDGTVTEVVFVQLNASLSQLSQGLKIASELQRLSVHEPTENVNISGSALIGELIKELDDLTEIQESTAPEPVQHTGVAGDAGSREGGKESLPKS